MTILVTRLYTAGACHKARARRRLPEPATRVHTLPNKQPTLKSSGAKGIVPGFSGSDPGVEEGLQATRATFLGLPTTRRCDLAAEGGRRGHVEATADLSAPAENSPLTRPRRRRPTGRATSPATRCCATARLRAENPRPSRRRARRESDRPAYSRVCVPMPRRCRCACI